MRIQKGVRTQQEIVEGAIALLASHGYAALTALAIQDALGMSRGRMLHAYASRSALLADVARS